MPYLSMTCDRTPKSLEPRWGGQLDGSKLIILPKFTENMLFQLSEAAVQIIYISSSAVCICCTKPEIHLSRKYCDTGPNTGTCLPHPTEHAHFFAIDKHDNTCYMLGSLPSAHTHTDFV